MKYVVSGIAILAAALSLSAWLDRDAAMTDVARGRSVYVAEGCLHCHSQYSRPETIDTEIYGPASRLESANGEPVLIGYRRQGPDLENVGARRSREWNRLHLIDPQAVSPGSRMPRFARLFDGAGERGEALLDYLDSLRHEDASTWFRVIEEYRPETLSEDSVSNGELLFRLACAQCHGFDGKGDGPLAGSFARPVRNLATDPFLFAPESLDADARSARLAQIVKYGIPGTSMPGHEYWTDRQARDVVAFLEKLREPKE